jgi:hypothetical protein
LESVKAEAQTGGTLAATEATFFAGAAGVFFVTAFAAPAATFFAGAAAAFFAAAFGGLALYTEVAIAFLEAMTGDLLDSWIEFLADRFTFGDANTNMCTPAVAAMQIAEDGLTRSPSLPVSFSKHSRLRLNRTRASLCLAHQRLLSPVQIAACQLLFID